jgi:diguanylate cyclase (GGDEF)-like protein
MYSEAIRRVSPPLLISLALILFWVGPQLFGLQADALHWWFNAGWLISPALAAAACFRAAQASSGADRKAWRDFGIGCGMSFCGTVYWAILDLQHATPPFPSAADAGYLFGSIFFATGMFRYGSKPLRKRVQICNLGLVLCAVSFAVLNLFQEQMDRSGESIFAVAVAVAYPAVWWGTAAFGAICTALYTSGRRRLVLAIVLMGVVAQSLADLLYGLALLGSAYTVGAEFDKLWVVGFGIVCWAAIEHVHFLRTGMIGQHDRIQHNWQQGGEAFVPVLATSIILGAVVTDEVLERGSSYLLVLPAALLLPVMLGLREYWTFRFERQMTSNAERIAEELGKEQVISTVALANMSQGLCMFDGDKRLVTCNQRFADLYGLPEELTRPGTPLLEILRRRVATNNYGGTPDEYIQGRLACADARVEHTELLEHRDGKAIQIRYRPLPWGGWVATHEDVTERRQAEERIAYLASHDALTGLPNRVLFREKLEAAIARGRRGHPFAVLLLDLDRFKEVNDSLGHAVGDKLLQKVADRLRENLREDDTVARLGGDEFAILRPDFEGSDSAPNLAGRLIQAIERPYPIESHHLTIGTSAGIAMGPGDGADPELLLKQADLALYRAKADGRGTFRFFEKEMDEKLQARRLLEAELRDGLSRGEMELFYQPVYCLRRELICGFEALLRWNHPLRGMVSPAEFIPVAEETGLINQIGEWVLREACAEAVKWPDDISVAVNLSAVQFKGRSLAQLVVHALGAAGLAPERLELKVTESVLLKESENSVGTLHMLRDIGVRIAMDDFGTGYSSLSYLRLFPFSRIKMDRSFVADITTKPDSAAIIHATIELARRLGIDVTAEGVETPEQLAMLKAEGCTEIQGYIISKPVPARDARELVARPAPRLAAAG